MIYEPPPWVDPSVLVPIAVRKSWAVVPKATMGNGFAFMFGVGFLVSTAVAKFFGSVKLDAGLAVIVAWFILSGWWTKRLERRRLAALKLAIERGQEAAESGPHA